MTFETRAVLGSRYVKLENMKTHSYSEGEAKTLCKRIKEEGLADVYADKPDKAPTCLVCLKRDPRFKE